MAKGTILLIDDDLDMLLIGQRIFGRAGYNFISARNGKEGLANVKSQKPDLILLDYILPDVSGKQFLETLAFEEEYADCVDIPVVILTARADFIDDLDRFFELGLKAYLSKPFGHRELVNVIDNIIRIHQTEKRRKSNQMHAHQTRPNDDTFYINTSRTDEVRSMAHTIISLCQMYIDSHNANLNDNQRIDIKAILNSCRNLLKIINGSKLKNVNQSELAA